MAEQMVVVGVDGSPLSLDALQWAAEEAQLRHTGLRVVHGWRPPIRFPAPLTDDPIVRDEAARAQAILDDAVRTTRAEIPIEPVLVEGPPVRTLLKESERARLLVVGSRGRGGFPGLLLGSVSQHCAQHARCPVAVVRPPEEGHHVQPRIVVGIDGSTEAQAALRWAVAEARRHDWQVDVLTAWQRLWPGPRQKIDLVSQLVETRARDTLAQAIAGLRDDAVVNTRTVVEDKPALALVEAAKGAALLVVGARGLGAFAGLAYGSVSQACAHHSPCTVVIVH
jgi:nucleotide-binding universal stress UspA family protein